MNNIVINDLFPDVCDFINTNKIDNSKYQELSTDTTDIFWMDMYNPSELTQQNEWNTVITSQDYVLADNVKKRKLKTEENSQQTINPSPKKAKIETNEQVQFITSNCLNRYQDITEYLTLTQREVAKKLGLTISTFSKRWREATCNRKWPWRNVRKIDMQIESLLRNIPKNGDVPEEIKFRIDELINQRQKALTPTVIRIS